MFLQVTGWTRAHVHARRNTHAHIGISSIPFNSVFDSILSLGSSLVLQLRHWTCGSVCRRTLMSHSTTKYHQSAFTTFCLSHKDEHHVFADLCFTLESPYGLGVLMLSRKALNNLLMFTLASLYYSELLGILCLCMCLSLAILTLDGFCGPAFSPVAQGGCGVSFPVLSLNVGLSTF